MAKQFYSEDNSLVEVDYGLGRSGLNAGDLQKQIYEISDQVSRHKKPSANFSVSQEDIPI